MTHRIAHVPEVELLRDDWKQFRLGSGVTVKVGAPFMVWVSGSWRLVEAGSYNVGPETAAAWVRRAPDRVTVLQEGEA